MAADADGSCGHPESPADFLRRLLRVEGQQQDRSFPFADRRKARGNACGIDRPFVWRHRVFLPRIEPSEQKFPARRRSTQAHCNHPARTQDERRNLIRIADFAGAKPLDDDQHHLLGEIVCGSAIAKMLQPVEADAWRKPPIQFGFRRGGLIGRLSSHRARQPAVSRRIV